MPGQFNHAPRSSATAVLHKTGAAAVDLALLVAVAVALMLPIVVVVLLELPQLVLVICIMQWCANVRACLLLLLLLERSPRLRRVLVVYPPSIA